MSEIREAARAELKRRGIVLPRNNEQPDNKEALREAARAELARRQEMRENQNNAVAAPGGLMADLASNYETIAPVFQKYKSDEMFDWPRFIGENLAKGVFSLADLGQLVGTLGGRLSSNKPSISEKTKKALKQDYGLDLDSMGEGSTAGQRIVGKAAKFAGSSIIPGASGLGTLKALGKNAALAAGMGATSGVLQEAGVPELPADIAGILAPGAAKRLMPSKVLKGPEAKVAGTLQEMVGEKELPGTVKNLANKPVYEEFPNYEPMTAEVANNPSLSQIHRARLGIPGSGLQDKAALQNEAIMAKIEEQSLKAATPREIKENVASELQAREDVRRKATKEGYEAVENMTDKMEPSYLRNFLEKKPAAGPIKKDLDDIRREIGLNKKPTKSELEYKNIYENASPSVRSKMQIPSMNDVQVNKLAAIDSSLTDKIEKYTKFGEKHRATVLRQAQEALRKDLDKVDLYKQTRGKYAELSKPVNEILEHPTLRNIPESRLNDIMGRLYDDKSIDNLTELKKVLGKKSEQWEGIQHATTDYLKNKITNAQAEGRAHVLSYPKMKRFIDQHEKALEKVYNADQMKVIKSIEKALEGQNVAKSLGQGVGSDTQAKQAIEKMLSSGLGSNILEYGTKGLAYPLKAIPFIGKVGYGSIASGVDWIVKNRKKKVVEVLDKALKEPEYAHKLLSSEFANYGLLDIFVNKTTKTIGPASVAIQDWEREE